ncbi:MAG: mechanosensitive ion channel, partial [Gemmatimonadetes bacterium]|nr:mechanosensitive ion channel family protein [Gemmatimonadota bacterium]NIR77272.1 mechanosensitive ion channel family protein [Gemmatimonadota bacterium]NIT85790.1 mechanosensitive ion channel family protein [Gemmatimonadota bacterium]NIU29616.1 mechanosensitive ion channel family protein [Gemmatimonadota bacterium]NIU34663.1 mechanosensitive ion channel [Gemmatimonadota bacterium]
AGNHVRIPNGQIVKGTLVNYTRNPRRRFELAVAVGPDDDLLQAISAGEEALERMEGVMDDPPAYGLVEELGDSWVTLRFFGWVDQRRHEFL